MAGQWDAVVLPAADFFAQPASRTGPWAASLLVHGPAHLLRAVWLAGATDYLKEPWTPEELFLRLRGSAGPVEWFGAGGHWLLAGSRASNGTTSVGLSAAEAGILRLLARRQGLAVSRAVLAWAAACSEGRVIDTLVGRLRQKLGSPDSIEAVRGVGYRLP